MQLLARVYASRWDNDLDVDRTRPESYAAGWTSNAYESWRHPFQLQNNLVQRLPTYLKEKRFLFEGDYVSSYLFRRVRPGR